MMSETNPIGANKEASSQAAENYTNAGETAGLRSFDPDVSRRTSGDSDPPESVKDRSRCTSGSSRGPQGTDKGGIASLGHQVEFLPKHIRQQRFQRRRIIRQGYLLVVCVAVMGILTYVRGGRVAQARGNLATLEKSRSNLLRQAAMIKPLERQMSDLLVKKQIDEELGGRTDCTVVLAELCRITPLSIVIVSLDLQTAEPASNTSGRPGGSSGRFKSYRGSRPTVVGRTGVKGAAVRLDSATPGDTRRVRMVITGLAMNDVDVANFIGQLAASRLFKNVNMGYTKMVVFRGRSAREFQASCYLAR